MNIPDEIKEKIKSAAENKYKAGEQMLWRNPEHLPPGMNGYIETYPLTRGAFTSGAEFGYGLASEEIERLKDENWIKVQDVVVGLNQEIERLKVMAKHRRLILETGLSRALRVSFIHAKTKFL